MRKQAQGGLVTCPGADRLVCDRARVTVQVVWWLALTLDPGLDGIVLSMPCLHISGSGTLKTKVFFCSFETDLHFLEFLSSVKPCVLSLGVLPGWRDKYIPLSFPGNTEPEAGYSSG